MCTIGFYVTQYSTDSVEDSAPSMTPRTVNDGSSVLVIVVPVSAAGTLIVITISVVLVFLLKRACKLPSLSSVDYELNS